MDFTDSACNGLVFSKRHFEDPRFVAMIQMAAAAAGYLNLAGEYLLTLKRLFASDAVKSRISLTCDAWQAGNLDGYFAVTGDYIAAHTGKRLRQVLYKVVERVGIEKKSSHVTPDNASVNSVMMVEYERLVREAGDEAFRHPNTFEDRYESTLVIDIFDVLSGCAVKRVKRFINELIEDEKDEAKLRKLESLRMTTKLLSLFNDAQQEFSAEGYPRLHLVLPAFERLHAILTKPRTERSDAYIICSVLDPTQKMRWFDTEWDGDARSRAWDPVRDKFKTRYEEMYGTDSAPPPVVKTSKKSTKARRLLSDPNDEPQVAANPGPSTVPLAAPPSWESVFNEYMNGTDVLLEDQCIVSWWGLNSQRLPVWAAIARDYIPIMASSVSSERVVSGGGVTIRKLRNRLRADVVEALQMLKFVLRNDTTEEALEDEQALEEEATKTLAMLQWDLDMDCLDDGTLDSTFDV
ncbi:uncharacterized protein ARMOST_07632 [Armillaria ostoyae]|uniref:HAT C-terminal dimerisation domain-containing protein n=1 Tax=Armillaria ostoyae TaxID=47428 RepID=A0A284R6C0_ARMOS|nr:uncharacterized protein ARMOST_07618 [Armillaria ostoyae]SJL04271.1 uncharacterized protein ARMOST_07632 [Armillaria ostoyae]